MSETAIVTEVREAEPALAALRGRHTVDGAAGMPPHITLLYPFTDTDLLDAARINEVRTVVEPFAAFDIELTATERFHDRAEIVLWLAPEPPDQLRALTEALAARFPEHPPFGGRFDSIVPHLTLAISTDEELLDRIERQLLALLPIRARIDGVGLFEHADTGWRLQTAFQLRRTDAA